MSDEEIIEQIMSAPIEVQDMCLLYLRILKKAQEEGRKVPEVPEA